MTKPSNIKALSSLPTFAQDQAALNGLQEVRDKVESGEIVEFFVVAKERGGDWINFATATENRLAMIGELECLKARMIEQAREDE